MFVVLINGRAGWVKRQSRSSLVNVCEGILVGQGRVFVTRELDDLDKILPTLDPTRITAIVPVGGDGTVSAVLTAACRHWGTERLPAFLPVTAGTMNMLARSLNRHRETPLATLNRLSHALRKGEPLASANYAFLRTGTGHAGFVAGFGATTRFLAHYYELGAGFRNAVATIVQHVGSILVNGQKARNLFEEVPVQLSVDGGPYQEMPLSVVLATTVNQLPLNFRLGDAPEGKGMSLLTGCVNPLPLVLNLPLMHRGLLPDSVGVSRHPCVTMATKMTEPQAWQLDGDIYAPVDKFSLDASAAVRLLI